MRRPVRTHRPIPFPLIGVETMANETEKTAQPAKPAPTQAQAQAQEAKTKEEAAAAAKSKAAKPENSGFDPIATMMTAEEDRIKAEDDLRKQADELAKQSTEDDREAVAYVIVHSAVGVHS